MYLHFMIKLSYNMLEMGKGLKKIVNQVLFAHNLFQLQNRYIIRLNSNYLRQYKIAYNVFR